jgi:hypothetical protein
MAKGTGTYDDPIIVDGIFSKTINGVKKFFKLNTGSKQSSEPSIDTDAFVKYKDSNLQSNHNVHYVDLSQDANAVISTNWYKSSLTLMTNSIDSSQGDRRDLGTSLTLYGYGHKYYPACCRITANNPNTKDSSTLEVHATQLLWNKKFLVTSVNGIDADDKGNVKLKVVSETSSGVIELPTNPMVIRMSRTDSNLMLSSSKDGKGGSLQLNSVGQRTDSGLVKIIAYEDSTHWAEFGFYGSGDFGYSTYTINSTGGQTLVATASYATSVNGKTPTHGKIEVAPEVDYSKADEPTDRKYTISKAGLLYIVFSSQNENATVSLKVNNIEVYSFKPATANLTNVKTLCGIVKKGDVVSITSSNATTAKWYTCDFITA